MSDKAVTHQFKDCTIDLRGAGYACVSRGDEFEIGHTGEGDRVLIEGDTLDFTGLHILGPVALADRIKAAVALECYALTTDRDALRAEIARLIAERDAALAGAVKVKPLVWSDDYRPVASPQSYQIWPDNGGSGAPDDPIETFDGYMLYSPTMMALGVHPTPEAAKAAAKADYEARILAAIQSDPEARQEALAGAYGPILDLLPDAVLAAEKAMRKYPQPNYVISKWAEETGEVTKDLIHMAEGRQTADKLRGEIVQSLAMLHRLLVEGDQVHGLPPVGPAIRALLPPADLAAKIGGE